MYEVCLFFLFVYEQRRLVMKIFIDDGSTNIKLAWLED
ncbi:TPA: plasmid segregation protein ParM domain-containing protein, partial [Escherichia coli]